MLHDSRSAVAMVAVAPPPHAPPSALVMTALLCGSVRVPGFGNSVSGVRPFSSAVAVTTSLKVDPGGFRSPAIVRLMSGSSGSLSSAS